MGFRERHKLIQKNLLIGSLNKSITEVFMSFTGNGKFQIEHFYSDSFYDEFGMQVLEQDFKYYKTFFKKLRKEYIPFEFVFALNSVKTRLELLIKKLNDYEGKQDYYLKNNFDYQIVIDFIDRFLSFFKYYNSELLYQYCFDLQKELFFINNRYIEQRLVIIEETLKTIYFNEKYAGKEQGFDLGSSQFGIIYLIKQGDAKQFFEKEIDKDEYKKLKEKSLETILQTSIDLSDSKGTEKIIFLEKLGIIEFLKLKEPFNLSTNTLASVISGFTGIPQTSVYPMINPIRNNTVNQKNNPMLSEKTVSKVNQKLISIGYKPKKQSNSNDLGKT